MVFTSSRSVDSEALVGQASWGLNLSRGRFILAYQRTLFPDLYEVQHVDSAFGSMTLSCLF